MKKHKETIQKRFNFDDFMKKDIKGLNQNWSKNPDHLYKK